MIKTIAPGESFDFDHYLKVRDARRNAQLACGGNGEVPGHHWQGKMIVRNGKPYRIEKVLKHWYYGQYWALLLNNLNDSHVLIYWENISCVDQTVLESIGAERATSCIVE